MFRNSKGELSSTRIMAFIALCTAVVLAFIGIFKGVDLTQLGVLVGSFLIPAFGGKAVQSFAEEGKNDKEEHCETNRTLEQ